MGFKSDAEDPDYLWFGDPDCQAAHDHVLEWMKRKLSAFMAQSYCLDNRTKGNIGETICFILGHSEYGSNFKPYVANAWSPLTGISRSGVDLVWVFFAESPADDTVLLQEVKVTSTTDLSYAKSLIADYKKLFDDSGNTAETLASRFDEIKNQLEFTENRPDLAARLDQILGDGPKKCGNVLLLPTMLYNYPNENVETIIAAVRRGLYGLGWAEDAVQTHSIGLSDLDKRLERLARGQS